MTEGQLSFDADLMADVRGAFDEVAAPEPTTKTETPEPKVKDEPVEKVEPKADHPEDERRHADGTFKKTKTDEPLETKVSRETTKVAETTEVKPKTAQQQIVQGSPPHGWSVKSKTEWDKLPDHIRADIVKREKEVSDGFAQYAGMKELQPYMEMAKQRGQTLKSALDHYTGIESLLYQNPLQGLLQIAQNIGYAPQRLAMELSPLLGPSNGNNGAQQQGHQQPAIDPNLMQLINPLQQEVYGLKSLLQQQHQAAQSRELGVINNTLERFKTDPAHRYFENVEPQIVKLFEGGVIPRTGDHMADLKTAYELACRMDPEISETLVNERIAKTQADRAAKEKEAAEKAKQASRSITGSASGGGSKDGAANDDDSIEDTVRKAYRAHAV